MTRVGLRSLVEEHVGNVVVGQCGSLSEARELVISSVPDVLLFSWDADGVDEVAALAETVSTAGMTMIVMGAAQNQRDLQILLRAGVRGFVTSELSAEDLAAVLHAVGQGLLVLDPILAPALNIVSVTMGSDTTNLEQLTDREREVLQLVALGLPNKTIANRLRISDHTVKFHVGSIIAKLGASSRTDAVARAYRHGLLAL